MIPDFDLTIRGTGAVLRRLREARGLSVAEVVERVGAGFAVRSLEWFEADTVGAPWSRLCQLAGVYGLTPEALLAELLGYARSRGVPLPTCERIRAAGEVRDDG